MKILICLSTLKELRVEKVNEVQSSIAISVLGTEFNEMKKHIGNLLVNTVRDPIIPLNPQPAFSM